MNRLCCSALTLSLSSAALADVALAREERERVDAEHRVTQATLDRDLPVFRDSREDGTTLSWFQMRRKKACRCVNKHNPEQ